MFGALEANGFRLALGGAANQPMSFQLGLGGGADAGRAGLMATWVPGEHSGHAVDWRLGMLSRPTPWLSLGGVADHLGQPRTANGLLVRDYTLGVGVRPLAMGAGARAHAGHAPDAHRRRAARRGRATTPTSASAASSR